MSLRSLLGLGRRLLRGKKESATPATGQELAVQEIRNPPVVLKKTQPLHMGDDMAPAFGYLLMTGQ